MRSPWCVPISNLKYFVVLSPFMMHDPWLFNRVLTHLMNILPNLYLFKAKIKIWWLAESKAFWMSTVTNIPSNFSTSENCKTSEIKHPPPLINLPSTQADWLSEISDGRSLLRRIDEGHNLVEKLASSFGLVFYLCHLFWLILLELLAFVRHRILHHQKNVKYMVKMTFFTSDQNVSKNPLVRPSFQETCH